MRAAIVYSTRLGAHEVGAGLMSHQRSEITQWAEQALPSGLARAPRLSRSQAGPAAPSNPRATSSTDAGRKAEQAQAAHARRIALAVATRVNMGIEPAILHGHPAEPGTAGSSPAVVRARLLWQTPALRDAAISAVTEILGLEGNGRGPGSAVAFDSAQPGNPAILTWDTPELTLELRCLRLTRGLADTLGIDPRARPKSQALAAGIGARRQIARAFLEEDGAHPDRPELALVEIDRRKDYDHGLDDPKFALRLGCADAGVLTKFVLIPKKAGRYNAEKDLDHRVRWAWQDGLRQLGVRVLPEHAVDTGLPGDLRYVAIWMVKRRNDGPTRLARHAPVAVMVTPLARGSALGAITGWDSGSLRWVPYPKFLLRLVKIAEIPGTGLDDPEDLGPADGTAPATTPGSTPVGVRVSRTWKQNMEEQRQETSRYLQK